MLNHYKFYGNDRDQAYDESDALSTVPLPSLPFFWNPMAASGAQGWRRQRPKPVASPPCQRDLRPAASPPRWRPPASCDATQRLDEGAPPGHAGSSVRGVGTGARPPWAAPLPGVSSAGHRRSSKLRPWQPAGGGRYAKAVTSTGWSCYNRYLIMLQ